MSEELLFCAPGEMQETELRASIEAPPPAVAENRVEPPFVIDERMAEPARKPGEAYPGSRFQSLTAVLERLWVFYEAMRNGKPVANADQVMAQISSALKTTRKVD